MTDEAQDLSAEEILKATGGAPLRGGRGWSCRGISTDTRTLAAGDLFIALAGKISTATTVWQRPRNAGPPASSFGRMLRRSSPWLRESSR